MQTIEQAPQTPQAPQAPQARGHRAPTQATITLEGQDGPIVAQVCKRGLYSMTVSRPLPFLKLQSEVTDDQGRPARILGVRVNMDGDTPALVLELAYDAKVSLDTADGEAALRSLFDHTEDQTVPEIPTRMRQERRDPTMPYVLMTREGAAARNQMRKRRDPTAPYRIEPAVPVPRLEIRPPRPDVEPPSDGHALAQPAPAVESLLLMGLWTAGSRLRQVWAWLMGR